MRCLNSSVKGWRMWNPISCSFCIVILYVGFSIKLNSYSWKLHFAKWTWRAHRHPQPIDSRHAKKIETRQQNIPWNLLLAEKFNSAFSAGTYHGQRVATSVLCNANQLARQHRTIGSLEKGLSYDTNQKTPGEWDILRLRCGSRQQSSYTSTAPHYLRH